MGRTLVWDGKICAILSVSMEGAAMPNGSFWPVLLDSDIVGLRSVRGEIADHGVVSEVLDLRVTAETALDVHSHRHPYSVHRKCRNTETKFQTRVVGLPAVVRETAYHGVAVVEALGVLDSVSGGDKEGFYAEVYEVQAGVFLEPEEKHRRVKLN